MTAIRTLAFTALAGLLAACSADPQSAQSDPDMSGQGADTAPAQAEPVQPAAADAASTVALDDAALHALLIANADDLVPSDWNSGEPAPDTALAYWHLPELDVDADRSAACTPLPEPENAYDCTLTFVSRPLEGADPDEYREATAHYRFNVREQDDGDLALLSPDVRWAVIG